MKDTTEIKVFFADTYALIEMTGGNSNYKPYVNDILLTSKFNLTELYYHFLHDYGKEVADHYLQVYSSCLIPITNISIQFGMEFKFKYKQEKLSYADCIGYALAQELGVPFLTGDQKFVDKEKVEFVK